MDLKVAEKLAAHQKLIDEFVDLTRRKRELEAQVAEIKSRLVKIGGGRHDKEFFEGNLLKAMQALGLKNLTSNEMLVFINRNFGVSCANDHRAAVKALRLADRKEIKKREDQADIKLISKLIEERLAEAEAAAEPMTAEEALIEIFPEKEVRKEFKIYEEFTLRGREKKPKEKGE